MTHEEYRKMEKMYKKANWILAIIVVLAICAVGFLVYKIENNA